jgi:hypothetical protein
LEPVSRPRGLVGQTHETERIHKRKRRKKTNGFVPKNRRNGKTKKKTRKLSSISFPPLFLSRLRVQPTAPTPFYTLHNDGNVASSKRK